LKAADSKNCSEFKRILRATVWHRAFTGARMDHPQQPPAEARRPRLFVIDDEQSIRAAISRFLTRRGWEVEEAEDGRVALEMLLNAEPSRYDVVMCDLRMPHVSGAQLHRELLDRRPELVQRLIFSSGDVASSEAADFLAVSERPVIEKPFELAHLEEVLGQLLARTRGTGTPVDAS
jgi:CheY-like chemotaxis protein